MADQHLFAAEPLLNPGLGIVFFGQVNYCGVSPAPEIDHDLLDGLILILPGAGQLLHIVFDFREIELIVITPPDIDVQGVFGQVHLFNDRLLFFLPGHNSNLLE